jgi:hypothetical protein
LQHIANSKIGTIKSKPNVKYPMIRLPQEYVEIIGQRAHVYKTDHDGQPAFLVVPYTQESARSAQLKSKVSKLSLETDADSRLSAIESQIAELKSLIFQDGSESDADRENQRPRARFEPASWPPQGHRITMLPHLGTASKGV